MINPLDKYIFLEGNKVKIFFRSWIPEIEHDIKKTILLIVHGMAEHISRYNDFGKYLSQNGYIVCGFDIRGHGNSVMNENDLGYLCDEGGFDRIAQDIYSIILEIRKQFPDHKIVILGHSMGSLISRRFIQLFPKEIDGLILSGTAYSKGLIGKTGILIAKLIIMFKGRKYESTLLDNMSFGNFNKRIKNPVTKFDWLSKDETIVKAYIDDPKCGFIFKTGSFLDLFKGIDTIHKLKNISKIPSNLPILLISGTEDPVGNYGKGPVIVYNKYKKYGSKRIKMLLLNGDRHEILNENDRVNTYTKIREWIDKNI